MIHGNLIMIKLLLDKRADVNAQNREYKSPLHLACEFHGPEVVGELGRAENAFIMAEDIHRNTPLHYAAKQGRLDNVKLLIEELGSSVEVMNDKNLMPVDLTQN